MMMIGKQSIIFSYKSGCVVFGFDIEIIT